MKRTEARIPRPVLAACMLVVCLTSATAQTDQEQIETDGIIEHEQGQILFPKPVGWNCNNIVCNPAPVSPATYAIVQTFKAWTPDWGNIEAQVSIVVRTPMNPRLWAIQNHANLMEDQVAVDNKVDQYLQPIPHATFRARTRPKRTQVSVYCRSNGYSLSCIFVIANKHVAKAHAQLARIASQIQIKLPYWPPQPPGYDYEPESGFELGFAKSASKKRRKFVHKFVKDQVRRFTKLHGPPALPPGEPVVLIVEDDLEQCSKLVLTPGMEFERGKCLQIGRLVVPGLTARDLDAKRACASLMCQYMLDSIYPRVGAEWIHVGERDLADMEAFCGKPLPYATKEWHREMKRVRTRLDRLILQIRDAKKFDCLAWAGFFRLGTSKHRKPYEDLLKDLRTTIHPTARMNAFRKTFDMRKLQEDARKRLGRKLKPVDVQ